MTDAFTAAEVQYIKPKISISIICSHQYSIRMRAIELIQYCIIVLCVCCVFRDGNVYGTGDVLLCLMKDQ